MLVAQFVQRRHECRLPHNPCAVFRNLLVARAVSANDEPVAPFCWGDPRKRDPASGACRPVGQPCTSSPPLIRTADTPRRAAPFLQRRDGGFELGRDLGALATGQTAAQFGTEFVDVVLKRDHRPLLRFKDGAGAPRRSGGVKDACAAKRGAGEPILPRATKEVRALARSLRATKLGGPRLGHMATVLF